MLNKSAIIYARWSSREQGGGTTLERQISNCSEFAEREGYEVTATITDAGVSAYTGANIRSGNLAKLMKDFTHGVREASETVLIVERLDRISRVDAMKAFAWMSEALSTGLTIRVAKSGQTLTRELMSNDISVLMSLILENFQSNHESKKKAERIASYWEIARNKGEINPNMRSPAWLEVQDEELVPKSGAQAIIENIFQLALEGLGTTLIAKRLNEDGVKTFSSHSKTAMVWTATRLKRILYNDAVIGFYTPHKRPRAGGEVRAGAKIERYPKMVSDEVFNAVNAKKAGKKGGRSNAPRNLLGRAGRCFHCGGAMTGRGSASKGHYYLYCDTAKLGGECDHQKGWRYGEIEKAILDQLLTRALTDDFFQDGKDGRATPLARELSDLKRDIAHKSDHLKWLLKTQADFTDSPEVSSVYEESARDLSVARQREREIALELNDLRGRVSPEHHIKRVKDIRLDLENEDEAKRTRARRIAKEALSQLIERADFDAYFDNVIVKLVGGIGTFLILYGDGVLLEPREWDPEAYRDHPQFKAIERFVTSRA